MPRGQLCSSPGLKEYPYNPLHPTLSHLCTLLLTGIRTFIDLTEPGELVPYSSLLPSLAQSLGIPPEEMLKAEEAADRINVIHCHGGIGRTGTVACFWLVVSNRVECGRETLEVVAGEWRGAAKCTRYPNSPETGAQCEFVRNWKS
ncbi:hypothetical protein BDQ17DRAFT_1401974 [Cyathus striatus]|nr:hypothetical protein BDQ17DRAFT_1401974 [Cyathus striatus]